MAIAVEMIGRSFSRLTVTRAGGRGKRGERKWWCRCECGAEVEVFGANLRRGNTTSCGCLHSEVARGNARHGHARGGAISPEYCTWQNMLDRCRNPENAAYRDYGGRGVTVCERWLVFENFLSDMGRRPDGCTLDRWPDNDGAYEPGNTRWATWREQQQNRRNTIFIEVDGERVPLIVAAESAGVKYATARQRFRKGWPVGLILGAR